MPSATRIATGNSVDYTPGAAVAAGDVVVLGSRVLVAVKLIAASALGALASTGAFRFPKGILSGDAIAVGVVVYWDAGNEVITTNAAGGTNKQAGYTRLAAAAADATVDVDLQSA